MTTTLLSTTSRSIATDVSFHSLVHACAYIRVHLYGVVCVHCNMRRHTRRREEVPRHSIPSSFPPPFARRSPAVGSYLSPSSPPVSPLAATERESGNVDAQRMANPERSLSLGTGFGGIFGACAPIATSFLSLFVVFLVFCFFLFFFFYFLRLRENTSLASLRNDLCLYFVRISRFGIDAHRTETGWIIVGMLRARERDWKRVLRGANVTTLVIVSKV